MFLRLDSDKPEVKVLRERYAVKGLPTVLVLDAKGEEVDRILGYEGPDEWKAEYLGYLDGVGTLGDLLARAGGNPSADQARAVAAKYLGRSDAANTLTWVAKAREAMPADAPPDYALALMEGEAWLISEPEKGRAALEALAVDPLAGDSGEEAFSTLGRHLKKQKMDAQLEVLYDGAMASRGEDAHFLNDYAWTFAERGIALDKALAAAQKAVDLSEGDPGILDTLAEVHFKRGEKELAVATIEKAIAAQPDDKYFQDQKKKFLGEARAE